MQKHIFSKGGFVLHKIKGDFSGQCSAWFDCHGELFQAEQTIGASSFPVKVGGPIWKRIQELGRVWK